MMSKLKLIFVVLIFFQMLSPGFFQFDQTNACLTEVDSVDQTSFNFLGTGRCDLVPLAVPRSGFAFELHVQSSAKLGVVGFMEMTFSGSTAPISLYIEKNVKEYTLFKNDGFLIGETVNSIIKFEVQPDGKVFIFPSDEANAVMNLPRLDNLPYARPNMGVLNVGWQWHDVSTRLDLSFPGVNIINKSTTTTAPTTITTTVNGTASTTTTNIDLSTDESESTTADPDNNGTSEYTPVYQQTWFIAVTVVSGLFFLIGVIAMAVVGVKLCRRHQKSRPSTTPRSNGRDTRPDIHINVDGYDLFVPGHPNERAEFRAADREKKEKMLEDFLGRRSQS